LPDVLASSLVVVTPLLPLAVLPVSTPPAFPEALPLAPTLLPEAPAALPEELPKVASPLAAVLPVLALPDIPSVWDELPLALLPDPNAGSPPTVAVHAQRKAATQRGGIFRTSG
jgi:hypothetical protein